MPDNVAVVIKDNQISTYALIDRTSLGLVYGSTVALELTCRGCRCLLASRSPWMTCGAIKFLNDAAVYAAVLADYAARADSAAEAERIALAAYRLAYAYVFRWNVRFPWCTCRIFTPAS